MGGSTTVFGVLRSNDISSYMQLVLTPTSPSLSSIWL